MKKTVYSCDITGEENIDKNNIIHISLFVNSTMDPSGNGYEDNFDEYDLGLNGSHELIKFMLKEIRGYDDKLYKKISKFLSNSKLKIQENKLENNK